MCQRVVLRSTLGYNAGPPCWSLLRRGILLWALCPAASARRSRAGRLRPPARRRRVTKRLRDRFCNVVSAVAAHWCTWAGSLVDRCHRPGSACRSECLFRGGLVKIEVCCQCPLVVSNGNEFKHKRGLATGPTGVDDAGPKVAPGFATVARL